MTKNAAREICESINYITEVRKFLTDTGEDSKLIHRRKRPKVDTLFSFFSDASERRVWLSAESKILASTFERFRLYRLRSKKFFFIIQKNSYPLLTKTIGLRSWNAIYHRTQLRSVKVHIPASKFLKNYLATPLSRLFDSIKIFFSCDFSNRWSVIWKFS